MPDYHDYKLECVLYDSISRSKMVNISKAIRAKNSCCRGVSSRGNARSTMLSYLYSLLMLRANDFSMEGTEGGGVGNLCQESNRLSSFRKRARGKEGEFGITPL